MEKIADAKAFVTWYHMLILLGSQLIFIPIANESYSLNEFSLWLSLSLLISLYLVIDFGSSQTFLKCNGALISGHKCIPDYGSYESAVIKKIDRSKLFCDLEYITRFNNFANRCFLRNSILMILITAGLFYLVLKNRFMALDFDANYILSFIIAIVILFFQSCNFYFYNKLISFKDYTKVRFIEANMVLLRSLIVLSAFYFDLDFIFYFIFYFFGNLLLFFAHLINLKTIRSIKILSIRKVNFPDKDKYLKGQNRQGILNISSALILNAFGLIGAQFKSSSEASLSLLTNRIFNVIKNFAQVPLVSNIPDLIKLRNTIGYKIAFNRFLRLHLLSILLFAIFSILNFIFFYVIEIFSYQYIYLNYLYFLYFFVLVLELNHSGFSQFYLTRNHIPFLWPSIISGSLIIILGLYFGNIYGALGLVISQGLVQLLFNNWYPVFKVLQESKFEKDNNLLRN
tara:strand:+ start:3920 stop:5287 length:1368 start_codon:yes stop_codon:yes gene_type:complete